MKLGNRFNAVGLSLLLVGSLAAVGCGGGDDEDAGVKPTDSGTGSGDTGVPPGDTGVPDTGVVNPDAGDGGVRDADAGPMPTCVVGTEGCPCTSTFMPDDMTFAQDNCGADLLCVPWDILSGRADDADPENDLTGPDQSCVKPCTVDADCGAGRLCRPSGFNAASGIENICFDEEVGFDEFCSLSKLTQVVLPTIDMVPGERFNDGRMKTCPMGLDCTINTFSDVHPDEGICLEFCTADADCAAPTPYCNPRLFTTTSSSGETSPLGVCSTAKLGRGSLCGSTDPEKVGLASRCDTDTASTARNVCVAVPGLFADNGFCVELCGSANTCDGAPGDGALNCLIADATDPQEGGFCSDPCTNFPNNCEGDGGQNLGRECFDGLVLGMTPFPLCMDKQGPPLSPGRIDINGMVQMGAGDDCLVDNTVNELRCPRGTFCLTVDTAGDGTGICFTGCTQPTQTSSVTGCESLAATTTCAAGLLNDPAVGLCGF